MLAPLFLYHGGCFDGFCAAWVWKCAFPDYEFVPVAHGCPPPDVKGRAVVIADFSYKRDVMKQLYADAQRVTVLDHHVSAEKELAGLVDELRHYAERCAGE
jgi:nanoRNase/pAp phosphatase (c-di-AMP/oligoRNAs hydrolase)